MRTHFPGSVARSYQPHRPHRGDASHSSPGGATPPYESRVDRGAFGILRNQLNFWMNVRRQQTVGAIVYEIESGYIGLVHQISEKLFRQHRRFDRVNQEIGLLTIEVSKLIGALQGVTRDPRNPRRAITEAHALVEAFKGRRGINFDDTEQRRATKKYLQDSQDE